jgi:hypothetical protein
METRREKKRTILTKPISLWLNRKNKLVNTKMKATIKKGKHK